MERVSLWYFVANNRELFVNKLVAVSIFLIEFTHRFYPQHRGCEQGRPPVTTAP